MNAQLTFHILTLFPEMFPGPLRYALAGKALERGDWQCTPTNIRDYAFDRYGSVDDTAFGGGPGMVLRADVLGSALEAIPTSERGRVVAFTPRGQPLTQTKVRQFAQAEKLTLICGRYEGIDERLLDAYDADLVSVGDYVLSGGEIAALALMDACVRLLPGVMHKTASADEESFECGLLEHPQYTRPRTWRGVSVPPVLLSGDHGAVAEWKQRRAEEDTRHRRPDLWNKYLESQGK